MTFKIVNNADAGTADIVGGNDWDAMATAINSARLPTTYIVYIDGSTYKALNCNTLTVDYTQATDAAALLRSVNTALASTGGTILIKNGTYNFLTRVTIPEGPAGPIHYVAVNLNDNIHVIGESRTGTILKLGASLAASVIGWDDGTGAVARQNVQIEKLTVDGNKVNNTLDNIDGNQTGIRAFISTFHKIENVEIKNCCQQGLYITGSQEGLFSHIYSHDNDKEGIHFDAERRSTAIQCVVFSNRSAGMAIVGGATSSPPYDQSEMTIIGGTAYNNNNGQQVYDTGDPTNGYFGGMNIYRARDVSVFGFKSITNGSNSAQNIRDGYFIYESEDVLLSGCRAWDNYSAGFRTELCNNIRFKDCRSSDNNKKNSTSLSGESAGFTAKNTTYSEIAGCRSYDTRTPKQQEYGIYEGFGSDFNSFHDNDMQPVNHLTGGIILSGAFSTVWPNNLGFNPQAIQTGTVGTSPAALHNLNHAPAIYHIQGGTVSQIDYSRDGTTYYNTGLTQGHFYVERLAYLQITHTGAPAYRVFPG